MFIIGIDIAKSTHEAVIIDGDGQIVQKAFRFQNSCSGYNQLLEKVRKFTTHRNQLVFAMESTSHYWLALYTRLKKEGYQVHVINARYSLFHKIFGALPLSPVGDRLKCQRQ